MLIGLATSIELILNNSLVLDTSINDLTPLAQGQSPFTSGMLLAYLATAKASFGQWIKFILPLFIVLLVLSMGSLVLAVWIGY